jgi:hypothetical protein
VNTVAFFGYDTAARVKAAGARGISEGTRTISTIFLLDNILRIKSNAFIVSVQGNVACRHVARQRLRKKQLYDNRRCVTASQTSMFPRQQLHVNDGTVFSVRSVPRCYK